MAKTSSTSPVRALFPWHLVLFGVGTVLLFVGLLCGGVAVSSAVNPAPDTTNPALSFWLFVGTIVVPLLITGTASAWLGWKQMLLRREAEKHWDIEEIARKKGYVTAEDASRTLNIPVETAANTLSDLATAGVCRTETTSDGTIRYIFPRRVIP